MIQLLMRQFSRLKVILIMLSRATIAVHLILCLAAGVLGWLVGDVVNIFSNLGNAQVAEQKTTLWLEAVAIAE